MSEFLRCLLEMASRCLVNRLPDLFRKGFFPSSLAIKSILHENCLFNRFPAIAGMLSIGDTLDLCCSPASTLDLDSDVGLLRLILRLVYCLFVEKNLQV